MNSELPFTCPDLHAGETEQDCPWAGIARQLRAVIQEGGDVEPLFASRVPGLVRDIKADGVRHGLMSMWGRSFNFDENVHAEIVAPGLVAALNAWAGLAGSHPVTHAGILHTYGYLFSLLRTPYGFKRKRWVDGAMPRGLGLPPALLSPMPPAGTLLLNATCLAGSIAFRGHPAARAALDNVAKDAPGELRIAADLDSYRVVEHLSRPTHGSMADELHLQTDIVPFSRASGAAETHLLVYSTWTVHGGRLVTLFPMSAEAARALLLPERMGDEVEVRVQYNGYVDGFSQGGNSLRGRRWLASGRI